MDHHARRSHLRTADNPEPRLDYVVSLEGPLGDLLIRIRYVPDRQVLVPPSLTEYFAALGEAPGTHLESVAAAILHDLNNELVARWVQVQVSSSEASPTRHHVTIEDRQPKWDNPGLLARLASN